MSYADRLLPEAERAKRCERIAAQKAQISWVKNNPEKYKEEIKLLEMTTPGMTHYYSSLYGVGDFG